MAEFRDMKLKELQTEYEKYYGKPTKNRNRKALAKKLGKDKATREHLCEVLETHLPPDEPKPESPRESKMKKLPKKLVSGVHAKHTPRSIGLGKILMHKYRDKRKPVKCTVVKDGFSTGGKIYSSLGEAAKAVSGQAWNGMLFWGLAPFPEHKKANK